MYTCTDLREMAAGAKVASFQMAKVSSEQKREALKILIQNLKKDEAAILEANRLDIFLAQAAGLSEALLERLSLQNRLEEIIHDIAQVIELSDPVGEIFEEQLLPNKLQIAKCRTPIGVIGVIYESRPNVTLDISALIIKSGNCGILRGGSETLHTNQVLVEVIGQSLEAAGMPKGAIQLVGSTDRAAIKELLRLHEYIDLIIPRGGSALQQFCRENSAIPVITGGIGICHLFLDESADLERSLSVIANAKLQRPTVCNALGTLLVHSASAQLFIPTVVKELSKKGVTFRLDPKAWELFKDPACELADASDWDQEWLKLILGIKVVENLEEAMEHIQNHSTGHSDGILTQCHQSAETFVRGVNSAAVYVNASTRFTDGGQFGLGAEVAVSTQKLHARGPMGLKELTSYKWIVRGDYQIRA